MTTTSYEALGNKIKIAVAMMGVLALAGVGWLTRGRARAETPPAAEKPSSRKPLPRAAASRSEGETNNRIAVIYDKLNALEAAEEKETSRLAEKSVETRLRLAECKEQLHSQEEEWGREHRTKENLIHKIEEQKRRLQEHLDDFALKTPNKQFSSMRAASRRLEKLQKQLGNEKASAEKWNERRLESLRPYRKHLFQTQEALHRLEAKQVRRREIFAAKREALLARLRQQLEETPFRLVPSNRLHDLERKLNALRREVGELRRALEKSKQQ